MVCFLLRPPIAFLNDDSSPSLDVPIATLDDPSPFAPEVIIWIEDRLPWVKLDLELPTFRQGRP